MTVIPALFSLLAFFAPAASPATAQSFAMQPFSDTVAQELKASGQVALLHFTSDDCAACKRQRLFLDDIRLLNPSFDQALTYVEVDIDTLAAGTFARQLDVQRSGSILLLQNGKPLGQMISSTARADIHALMELAFSAY